MDTYKIGLMVFSYVLGGIPSGYLIARAAKGIDIRQHGSGNPGAANVYRVVGKWAGWATLLADAAKGFIPVQLVFYLYPHQSSYKLAVVCGSLAIFGHMWTVFLKFKGGKGVATSLGVFSAMLPFPTMIAFCVFALAVALSGHISVGSIAAAAVLPAASFIIKDRNYDISFSVLVSLVSLLIIYKHLPNMKRLLAKKELAFSDGSKADDKKP
ncbi:MAG: glycerol-3-phosphate 1-O-acyltransferase PlsY [Elusimicrobiales bacterium]